MLELLQSIVASTEATRGPGDGQRLAAEAVASGWRSLVAVGGDGTAFEVLNGSLSELPEGERLRLAVLPLGTGNSLARHFAGRHADVSAWAQDALRAGATRPCDVLTVKAGDGLLYAFSSVTFGLPTRVASLVNRHLKPIGNIGYTLGALKERSFFATRPFAWPRSPRYHCRAARRSCACRTPR